VEGVRVREREMREERRGEKRGRRRLGRLPKTSSTSPETGSTSFAAARTVNAQKKRSDYTDY
jgi:hypothetical protein